MGERLRRLQRERMRVREARRGVDERHEKLLGALLALGELPDAIAAHHVLGGHLDARGPLECGNEEIVLEHRQVVVLGRPVRGDGVQDVRRLLGIEGLVIGGRVPGQHGLCHAD